MKFCCFVDDYDDNDDDGRKYFFNMFWLSVLKLLMLLLFLLLLLLFTTKKLPVFHSWCISKWVYESGLLFGWVKGVWVDKYGCVRRCIQVIFHFLNYFTKPTNNNRWKKTTRRKRLRIKSKLINMIENT